MKGFWDLSVHSCFLSDSHQNKKNFGVVRSFCSGLYFVLLKGGYDRIDRSIYSELILVLQTFRCLEVLGYFSYQDYSLFCRQWAVMGLWDLEQWLIAVESATGTIGIARQYLGSTLEPLYLMDTTSSLAFQLEPAISI